MGYCPKCGCEMIENKYKEVLELESFYFTVYLVACPECGYVDDEQTFVD